MNQHATLASSPPAALELTHSLLRSFYTHVTPLSALLPPDTLQEGDDDAFRVLVNETMVGTLQSVPLMKFEKQDDDLWGMGMKDVITRAQDRLFAIHNKTNKLTAAEVAQGMWTTATPQNILTLGYRPAREGEITTGISSSRLLFNAYTNTIITSLTSSLAWSTLISRIGSAPLFTLFSSPTTALFTPLPNCCYLQISGMRICDLTPRPGRTLWAGALEAKIGKRAREDGTKGCAKGKGRAKDDGESDGPKEKKKKRKRKPKSVTDATGPAAEANRIIPRVVISEFHLPPPPPSDALLEERRPKRPRLLGASISAPQLLETTNSNPNLCTALPRTQALERSNSLRMGGAKRSLRVEGIPKEAGSERETKKRKVAPVEKFRTPNEIVFQRNKMCYARPLMTSRGKVGYGFSARHILTRLPKEGVLLDRCCRHLSKHIFPRQFGLANVFKIPTKSWAPKPDFDLREDEILKLGPCKTPKRLKGEVGELVKRLILLARKVNHRKLLDRHCPSKIKNSKLSDADKSVILDLLSEPRTQVSRADISLDVSCPSLVVPHGGEEAQARVNAKPKFSDFMCTPYEVESYIKAVIRDTIPRDFWGSEANEKLILDHVSSFLRMRRFETFSLHTILQKFSVADCDWLRPRSASFPKNMTQKPNAVEMNKRRELLQEFLFWFIDSFLTDLAKTAFSITEGAAYRNRMLFFRQDDWHTLCKPLIENLCQTQYEPVPQTRAERILSNRVLGFARVRVLPKGTGFRPIVNLKHRATQMGPKGRLELGKSINSHLENVFQVLNFEKSRQADLLGASVLGPTEIYAKIKQFKSRLVASSGGKLPKLYLVKVDVQACFDTIKQEKLLEILEDVFLEEQYRIQQYAFVKPNSGKVTKKFTKKACSDKTHWHFPEFASKLSKTVRHAIFADKVTYPREDRQAMLQLIREHVTNNLIKIGGKFYRQKDGIPQGSILSSVFCSFFYGRMEATMLQFLKDPAALLVRNIDDFLLITTKKPIASRFLKVMDDGLPEFGCFIAAEKRLTNFDIALRADDTVPPLRTRDFPWCGLIINTETLDVKADGDRYEDVRMSDTLNIQRHRKPGQEFLAKMLAEIKRRSHLMFHDTNHNSAHTVYVNVYRNFLLAARKFVAYIHEWGADPRTRFGFFLNAIEQIVKFSYVAIRTRSLALSAKEIGGECNVRRSWVAWLGKSAFHKILKTNPTRYNQIVLALEKDIRLKSNLPIARKMRRVLAAQGN